jgi:hypothetical protein
MQGASTPEVRAMTSPVIAKRGERRTSTPAPTAAPVPGRVLTRGRMRAPESRTDERRDEGTKASHGIVLHGAWGGGRDPSPGVNILPAAGLTVYGAAVGPAGKKPDRIR